VKWKTGYSYSIVLWQNCLEFCSEKPFTILNAYLYALFFFPYSFSFDPSLWWALLLNMAAIKGFPHPVIMHTNTLESSTSA